MDLGRGFECTRCRMRTCPIFSAQTIELPRSKPPLCAGGNAGGATTRSSEAMIKRQTRCCQGENKRQNHQSIEKSVHVTQRSERPHEKADVSSRCVDDGLEGACRRPRPGTDQEIDQSRDGDLQRE